MISEASYSFSSEAYIVEKTIEVVAKIGENLETIRIEGRRDLSHGRYSTRAFIEENVMLQPTYPKTGGKYDRSPQNFRIWVSYDLPWTDAESADGVLSEALSFLEDRCSK